MSTFHYRAYTAQGVITTGAIVADGIDAAVDALYGSGLTPFETTHHAPGEKVGRFAPAHPAPRKVNARNPARAGNPPSRSGKAGWTIPPPADPPALTETATGA